jgi:serine/threonine protein kinase/Tol biopolymer transport system component
MLITGMSLGPYRIEGKLGEGGMGEVYQARDTRLKRDVAVKVLPPALARNPDRCARLRREAELLASLNHPHIAAVYGLEESNDLTALVMELVDGPTLADRLRDGPIPTEEALAIARQIAEALEAAHTKGIIHRDLKPANIKLRPDGVVKVLDFGLAKSLEVPDAAGDLAEPTTALSPARTISGVILGTPTYLSPEQARGIAVDARTDIWAFGCVLFEMCAGKRPFAGPSLTDTMAAILKDEPDWPALPSSTPVRIRSLIARCLRKDPAQRLRDIADGRFQIEDVSNDPGGPVGAAAPRRASRAWVPWIAAALLLITVLLLVARPRTSSSPEPISFPLGPPERADFSAGNDATLNVPAFALSPDGRAIVFCAEVPGARPTLWLRTLDHVEAQQIPGTDDAENPFWSPDGHWVGFFAKGVLKKVQIPGGAVKIIAETRSSRTATWGTRDTILISSGAEGIDAVNAAGGAITHVTSIDPSLNENTHRNPSFLPDGDHFLYSVIGNGDKNGVYVSSLDGKTKKLLLRDLTSAVYADPGYVLFVRRDSLFAQAFNAGRLELSGQPFFVAEHVGRSTSFLSGVSASATSTIAYAGLIGRKGRLTWIDRQGNPTGSVSAPEGEYTDFRLSPDETRLGASIGDPKTNVVDIWITDLARGTSSRVESDGIGAVTAAVVWSPDGARLAFRSNRTGVIHLYERSAAGGGPDHLVPNAEKGSSNLIATDWSPDGRQLLGTNPAAGGGTDLWLFPLGNDAKPTRLIGSPALILHGNFSPDGHLVAYTSNVSGRYEIYVETVPQSDRKWLVSTSGGYEPRWRSDGRELYYLSEDRKLVAVDVGAGPSFGVPRPLFQTHVPAGVTSLRTHYVPARDGQRFLLNEVTDAAASPITVVLNWTGLLNK